MLDFMTQHGEHSGWHIKLNLLTNLALKSIGIATNGHVKT